MSCCTYPATGHFNIEAREAFVSEFELDYSIAGARKNGVQEANLNAGYHCDPQELNLLHPVWKETNEDNVEVRLTSLSGKRVGFGDRRVTFGEKVSQKVGWDSPGNPKVCEEDTDFVERGERPLCKVVKIVEAVVKCSGPIIPILIGVKDKDVLQKMDKLQVNLDSEQLKGMPNIESDP